MEHTTVKGTIISIDDKGIAEVVRHPKITERVLLGDGVAGKDVTGLRNKYTLDDLYVKCPIAMQEAIKTPWHVSGRGLKSGRTYTIGLSTEDLEWLRTNWPIDTTPTREEKWAALMPPDVKALREWNGRMNDWQREFNKCMEDEMRSSFAPKMPTDPKPDLTPEGKAWLELDRMTESNLYYVSAIGRKAIDAVLDGKSLLEAERDAKAEEDKELEERMWD